MSDAYIRRLRTVQAEFNATQQALTYVDRKWQQQAIYREVEQISPRDLAAANRNLEQTYYIRLFAEFEGILKDHLAMNWPSISVPTKPVIDWLIRRVMQAEGLSVDPRLRLRLGVVRDYRNSIAHRVRNPAPAVTLVAALSTLNTFLAKLPEPLQ